MRSLEDEGDAAAAAAAEAETADELAEFSAEPGSPRRAEDGARDDTPHQDTPSRCGVNCWGGRVSCSGSMHDTGSQFAGLRMGLDMIPPTRTPPPNVGSHAVHAGCKQPLALAGLVATSCGCAADSLIR